MVCSMVGRLNGKVGERVVIAPDDGLMVGGRRVQCAGGRHHGGRYQSGQARCDYCVYVRL